MLTFFNLSQLEYSKTCLKRPLKKKTKIGFQDRLSLNAGQKYCRMLPLEHSAILLTFIKLPFAFKIFVLSIFEWLLKTGFTIFISINGATIIDLSQHMRFWYNIALSSNEGFHDKIILEHIFEYMQQSADNIFWT